MAKKHRSAASCLWHSILCVIAVLLLITGMATTLAVRSYIKEGALAKAVKDMNIAQVAIGDQTVAEKIRQEYVTDSKVQLKDIETAIHGMGIEAFAAEKLTGLGKLLRGESDAVVQITADEIIGLLEKSEYDLYTSCLLMIEDSDKQEIRNVTAMPLKIFNGSMNFMFGSPAMRAVSRYFVSTACVVVDIILLALLLWRLMVIRSQAEKSKSGACVIMGVTILVPAALTFIATAVHGISGAFTPDGVVTLHTITDVLAHPFWGISLLGVLAGILLILTAAIMRRVAQSRLDAALAANNKPVAPVGMGSIDTNTQPDPFNAPLPERTPAPAADTVPCVSCGRALAQGAKFCIYCGAPQTAPAAPPAEEAPASAAPVTESVGASAASAPAADTPAAEESTTPAEDTADLPVTESTEAAEATAADTIVG